MRGNEPGRQSWLADDGTRFGSPSERINYELLLRERRAAALREAWDRYLDAQMRPGLEYRAPANPSPALPAKLLKVGLIDEIKLKLPADTPGEGLRVIPHTIGGGKLRRFLADGRLGSFKGETLDFIITMEGNLVVGRAHFGVPHQKWTRS